MSAFIAVKQTRRVRLLTDGAVYDGKAPDIMLGTAVKVLAFPEASACVTCRGVFGPEAILASAFSGLSSFEELIQRAPEAISDARSAARKRWGNPAWEVLIAGVSKAGISELHYSSPGEGEELRLIEEEYWTGGPNPDIATYIAAGFEPVDDMEAFDPIKHGLPVMEAFRRTPTLLLGADGKPRPGTLMHGVGAFVLHTVITPGSITSKIIHVWDDRIGEKIDPNRPPSRLNLHSENELKP